MSDKLPARVRRGRLAGRPAAQSVRHPRPGLVDALVESGATREELLVIASGRDLAHSADLIGQKLQADRSEAALLCGAWIGGIFAFGVGDFAVIASIRDVVYTTADYVAVGGLTVGALVSAVTARNFFLRSRAIMRKLLTIQRTLARWDR